MDRPRALFGPRASGFPFPVQGDEMNARRRLSVSRLSALFALPLLMGLVNVAEARITRIQITTLESPTFGGVSFGNAGPYEKLSGKAYGELDPNLEPNRRVALLLRHHQRRAKAERIHSAAQHQ